jgi:hypothetical protein
MWIELSSPRFVRRAMMDFGYNGPPFHAAIYHWLFNTVDLNPQTLSLVATIDGLGLLLMLGIACSAFGWQVGLVFALLFLTQFADRGTAIGAAFGRYPWMTCLGIAIACLKRQRHALAGGFMVVAAMFSVFPVLFSLGVFARRIRQALRERAIPGPLRRFVGGCVVATALCGAVASPIAGVDEYRAFFDDMALHEGGSPAADGGEQLLRQPGFGVGLKFPFLYRGTHSRDHAHKMGRAKKSRQFREIEPLYAAVGWGLALIALGIATRLDDVEASILVGVVWFFCLFGTVYYYFTIFAFLALLYHRRYGRASGVLLLVGFWATSVMAPFIQWSTRSIVFVFNTAMSTVWLAYLITVLVVLGTETGWWRDTARALFASGSRKTGPRPPA